ncbi:MAG: DUF1460 domain-containing protein [Bacteroidales bacterium]|nr:DUF1460 domain-containing protein [Bacteroidales bacterium]
MKKILLLTLFIGMTCSAQESFMSNVRYSDSSPAIFEKVAEAVSPYKDEPAGNLMVRIAKQFLGTAYVGGTLETEPEQLTINMDKTDCILFVEMCLALTQTIKSGEPTFENFCRNTQNLRYRDGKVDGYASRNHYTSSWIKQGQENGIFREVSKELGGSRLDQRIDFMSTHLEAYKQLKDNPGMVVKIMQAESDLNKDTFYYLPQSDISNLTKGISSGDIICFVTTVDGLDIGHVAIAVEQNGQKNFIHASTNAKKVIIDKQTIADYVLSHKSSKGVRVVRIN